MPLAGGMAKAAKLLAVALSSAITARRWPWPSWSSTGRPAQSATALTADRGRIAEQGSKQAWQDRGGGHRSLYGGDGVVFNVVRPVVAGAVSGVFLSCVRVFLAAARRRNV